MADIVLTAAPYCYGPTAKALCLATELMRRHRLTYVGDEPGLSLARAAGLHEVIENRDRDCWGPPALRALARASCLVSALDGRAIKQAKTAGVPGIFLDTLLWLRSAPLPFTPDAQLYIAQKFLRPPSSSVTRDLPHLRMVGSILPDGLAPLPRPRANRRIVVNFGGLTSPVMQSEADIRYISWIISALGRTSLQTFDLVVCIPLHLDAAASMARALLPAATIISPPLATFHQSIARCDVLLTAPGLETVLEAGILSRPIVFLPPHNGTQMLQLAEYTRHGVGDASPALALGQLRYMGEDDLIALTRAVQTSNRERSASDAMTQQLGYAIEHGVRAALRLEAAHYPALSALGNEGRSVAVALIERVASRVTA